MPTYKDGDEKSYFPALIAGLLVVAVSLATFIFSLIRGSDENVADELNIREENGVMLVDPSSGPFPDGAPNLPVPVNPPM